MNKRLNTLSRNFVFLSAILMLVTPNVFSQASKPPDSQSANDAMNTVLSIAKVNNLEQDGVHPWHLKATYEIFDMQGQSKGTGTYEEWWVSAKKNKHTFAANGFTKTDYFTEQGVFRIETGKSAVTIGPEQIKSLVRPLSEEDFEDFKAELQDRQSGNLQLKCATLSWNKGKPVVPITHAYCVDPDHMILRVAITEYGFYEKTYNDIARLGDQYVAKDIHVTDKQWPVANIKVDQLEEINNINDADFVPPVEAKKPPPNLTGFGVITGTVDQHLVRKVEPSYPEKAFVEEQVIVKTKVDKDGDTEVLDVGTGPQMLRQLSAEAVGQWKFRPYIANHEPQEVHLDIMIAFSKNKPPVAGRPIIAPSTN